MDAKPSHYRPQKQHPPPIKSVAAEEATGKCYHHTKFHRPRLSTPNPLLSTLLRRRQHYAPRKGTTSCSTDGLWNAPVWNFPHRPFHAHRQERIARKSLRIEGFESLRALLYRRTKRRKSFERAFHARGEGGGGGKGLIRKFESLGTLQNSGSGTGQPGVGWLTSTLGVPRALQKARSKDHTEGSPEPRTANEYE